jgi:hypothetical protein
MYDIDPWSGCGQSSLLVLLPAEADFSDPATTYLPADASDEAVQHAAMRHLLEYLAARPCDRAKSKAESGGSLPFAPLPDVQQEEKVRGPNSIPCSRAPQHEFEPLGSFPFTAVSAP